MQFCVVFYASATFLLAVTEIGDSGLLPTYSTPRNTSSSESKDKLLKAEALRAHIPITNSDNDTVASVTAIEIAIGDKVTNDSSILSNVTVKNGDVGGIKSRNTSVVISDKKGTNDTVKVLDQNASVSDGKNVPIKGTTLIPSANITKPTGSGASNQTGSEASNQTVTDHEVVANPDAETSTALILKGNGTITAEPKNLVLTTIEKIKQGMDVSSPAPEEVTGHHIPGAETSTENIDLQTTGSEKDEGGGGNDDGDMQKEPEKTEGNGSNEDDNAISDNMAGKAGQEDEEPIKKASEDDQVENSGGHFFAYLLSATFFTAALYLLYHNKRKVIAWLFPGSQRRTGTRHGHNAKYERLESRPDSKTYSF